MTMRKQFVAGLASSALLMGGLSGCGSRTFEERQPQNNTVPAETELQRPFDAIAHYWEVTRGLGKLGITLVELPDDGSYQCGRSNEFSPNDPSPAYYCAPTNTIVVLPKQYNALETSYTQAGGNPTLYPDLLLGHEYGHGIENYFKDDRPSQRYELDADCLDGEVGYGLNQLDPKDARIFYDVIGKLGDDPSHGTAYQRYTAFSNGQIAENGIVQGCGFREEKIYPMATPGI